MLQKVLCDKNETDIKSKNNIKVFIVLIFWYFTDKEINVICKNHSSSL